jgi:ADP-ribosylglycohydrolase
MEHRQMVHCKPAGMVVRMQRGIAEQLRAVLQLWARQVVVTVGVGCTVEEAVPAALVLLAQAPLSLEDLISHLEPQVR